jgi:chromosome segregation ATPase
MDHRKEHGMTVELEEFTEWRHRVDARLGRLEAVSDEYVDKINNQRGSLDAIHADLGEMRGYFVRQQGMLQALHITQSEHTARLTRLEVRAEALDVQVQGLKAGMQKVQVGVQTIIGLLDRKFDGGGEPGDS